MREVKIIISIKDEDGDVVTVKRLFSYDESQHAGLGWSIGTNIGWSLASLRNEVSDFDDIAKGIGAALEDA